MVVCDDRRLIRYYLAGWPSSCHDNRIFRNSRVAASPHRYFHHRQCILGDSAFEASWYVVPAYKKPQGHSIPREHENFNACLSTARIISEHTIGVWKARFPWLRNIPMLVTDVPESTWRIVKLIKCTVILHNFLISEKEPEVPDEWLEDDDTSHLNETDELDAFIPPDSPNNLRQTQLMTYVNEILF